MANAIQLRMPYRDISDYKRKEANNAAIQNSMHRKMRPSDIHKRNNLLVLTFLVALMVVYFPLTKVNTNQLTIPTALGGIGATNGRQLVDLFGINPNFCGGIIIQ
jgi:hypothetical protein